MACRTIGECRFGAIDREFDDGITAPGEPAQWSGAKQFAYVRYDFDVTAEGLRALGTAMSNPRTSN